MSNAFALFGLNRRPPLQVIAFAWALVMALLLPLSLPGIMDATSEGLSLVALLLGTPSEPVRQAIWIAATLSMGILGVVVHFPRLELEATPLGWTLPGARQALAFWTLLIGAPFVAGLAAIAVLHGTLLDGLAVAVWASGSFMVPVILADAYGRRWGWWLVTAFFLALMAFPFLSLEFPQVPAEVAIMFGLPLLVAGLRLQFSRAAARGRSLRSKSDLFGSGIIGPAMEGSSQAWQRVGDGGLLGWLRAAVYESITSRRLGIVASRLWIAVWGAAMVHAFGNPIYVMFAGFALVAGGITLSTNMQYPISRAERHRIAFTALLLDAAGTCALMGAAVWLGSFVDWPVIGDGRSRVLPWPVVLGLAFALAPIAQFRVARGTQPIQRKGKWDAGDFLAFVAFFTALAITEIALNLLVDGASSGAAMLSVPVIALAVHSANWISLGRHYARADLAPPSSG